jgi:eukaryotic-like serine/threonine-protein kinase
MPTASTWTVQYAIAALLALFASPLLSRVSAGQSFPITLFGLEGGQTMRLAVEALTLLGLCVVSVRTFRHMPDNGRGASFIRELIFPFTALLALIVTDKTLRVAALPFTEQLDQQRYRLAYTAGLGVCGLWISGAWLWNFDALSRFFAISARPDRTPHSEHEDGISSDEDPDHKPSSTAMLNRNGNAPTTLGRYRVLKEIGRGAMGVVYLGKDPTIQRFVAIKTMRLDEIESMHKLQEVKARFFKEAESTGRLSHPNIVTIYDAGEEQDLGYIAMEMLDGTTLKQRSRPPHLMPLDQLLPTLATVAEALDYAHEQGVVHRDIKPANIMLTNDQTIKVMDFGIAKMLSSSKTESDLVLGTPTYMSPEQIAGKKVDGRSDIFSLGVVLFELLTGRPPFTADNVSALLFAITHTPALPAVTYRSDLSPMVQEVLDQALEKDPVLRYRRAAELAQDLRACLHKSTV